MNWDLENENRLRELAGRNLSARVIGALMGCSKNVIIGKARRLGVALNGHVRDGMNANATACEFSTAARRNPNQTPDVLNVIERTAGSERQRTEVNSHNGQKGFKAVLRRVRRTDDAPWTKVSRARRAKAKAEGRIAEPVKTLFDVLPVVPPICEAVEEDTPGVALADLQPDDCRAIDASGRYCGAPVYRAGASWCKDHHARFCLTAAQARRERAGRWS